MKIRSYQLVFMKDEDLGEKFKNVAMRSENVPKNSISVLVFPEQNVLCSL